MRRIVTMVVLGIGGLLAAIALTLGALALAGSDLGETVRPRLNQASQSPTHSPSSRGDESSTPTPSVDDHGSASPSVDDHGGNSGPGGGDDNSGHGSDSSGSGSGHSDDDD